MNVMYQALSVEQVFYLHEKIIDTAKGLQGIRDYTLLHSALERCKATFAGEDLYPTLLDKASALMHSLIMNHPFLDGNKRTGYEVTQWFLFTNGVEIHTTVKEVVRFCVAIDNEGLSLEEIRAWLKKHTKKIRS